MIYYKVGNYVYSEARVEIVISKAENGITVKEWLYKNKISHALVTRLKRIEGGITVNGEHATVRRVLCEGDVLTLAANDRPEEQNESLIPTKMPLDIIYEDDDIIAVNKPYDMATHPSIGHFEDTLANGLAYYFSSKNIPFIFRAINRLDRDTSGVVLVAKNQMSAARLATEMQAGEIKKTYIAVLGGVLCPESGEIDKPIRRKQASIITREACDISAPGAKNALTSYQTLAACSGASVVRARPQTGRTHQLRVHFSYMGAPIVGDGMYGTAETCPSELDKMMTRHALHAASLEFMLGGRRVCLEAALPEDMAALVRHIEKSEDKR